MVLVELGNATALRLQRALNLLLKWMLSLVYERDVFKLLDPRAPRGIKLLLGAIDLDQAATRVLLRGRI